MAAEMFEEHLEQVLFRIPPDDSASHFRAALVSKRWCRLICYPGFCCRFCKFHGTPPLTAFFLTATQASITCHHFVATIMMTTALQSCHGRVTDVVTDELRKLPRCPLPYPDLRIVDCNVVVLCAVLGEGSCDHLDYNHGPFIHGNNVLIRSALYFKCHGNSIGGPAILKYDLPTGEAFAVHIPKVGILSHVDHRYSVLMAMEDGSKLRFAFTEFQSTKPKLYLWSRREDCPDEDARWAQSTVIELVDMLHKKELTWTIIVVAFANTGAGVVFVWTCGSLFSIDLESVSSKMLGNTVAYMCDVVPYMSFCTPGTC
ncbi:hypothetical protein BDA96_02G018100 [Sorghum bicolor]|uniref:F-box domain-containing protein n=2 Tax=Sorghum bicolor TaxID=4558 RepID=A0A921RJG0_SORBI|nr:hypothetical protein BDA96_02G018100 [Sorghum bicolor]OQU88355.1 hypothetical protein SORBI_3002G017000 [Sorghum bicolor]